MLVETLFTLRSTARQLPHPYGPLSLVPPVVAIGLAIVTRRAALSLVVGIYLGALVTTEGNPFTAVDDTITAI